MTTRRPQITALATCLYTCLACVALHAAAESAAAQVTDYRTLFIGENAQGLGTAYTAVASTPTAAFHNPAGLAVVRGTSLASSLTLINLDSLRIENGFAGPAGVADLDSESSLTLPFSIGFNFKFGRRLGRLRRNSIAFTTVSPLRSSIGFGGSLEGNGITDRLVVTQDDQATWYGLSYARQFSESVSLGLSVFFADRSLSHVQSQTTFQEGPTSTPDGRFLESVLTARDIRTRIDARHLVARLGLLWSVNSGLRVGAMVQPPGLSVGGSGSVDAFEAESDLTTEPASSRSEREEQEDLPAALPIPWELRVGIQRMLGTDAFFSADAGVTGWNDDVVLVEPRVAAGRDEPPSLGLFLPSVVTQRARANLAVGLSALVHPHVPLRGGLFFESPSSGRIPATSTEYRPVRLWTLGASLAVGYRSSLIDLDVGAVVQYGFGEGAGLDPNRADSGVAAYVRQDARRFALLVFLGGYRGTVERLADEAYRGTGLKERLEPEDTADPSSRADDDDTDAGATEGEGAMPESEQPPDG